MNQALLQQIQAVAVKLAPLNVEFAFLGGAVLGLLITDPGRSVGHRRNADMAARAEALVAIWDGKSPGTRGMIDIARKRGLKVHVQDAAPKARNYIDVAEGETP